MKSNHLQESIPNYYYIMKIHKAQLNIIKHHKCANNPLLNLCHPECCHV